MALPWLASVAIGFAFQVVGSLFGPKPEEPKKPALKDFEEPTADASRPVPAVFGTVEITGLNALWWGEKNIRKRMITPPSGK